MAVPCRRLRMTHRKASRRIGAWSWSVFEDRACFRNELLGGRGPAVRCLSSRAQNHAGGLPKALPPRNVRRLQSKLVKQPADDVIHHVIDRLWPVIKGRDRRKDDGPHAGQGQHVLKVNLVEGALARKQNQLPSFL